MRNKNLGLKTTLLVGSMVGMSLSFTLSASFTINLGDGIQAISDEAITNNIMPVHFSDNGNDFGGFLYIQDGDNLDIEENVTFEGGSGYVCQQQVRGFYYNSERGERLWPLDWETKNNWSEIQDGLNISGGLYTRCISQELKSALNECANLSGSTDAEEAQCEADARDLYGTLYGYYGQLTHNYVNQYDNQQFVLVMGAQYTGNGSWLAIDGNRPLSESFIRYDNKYPVGLLYDYNGGVGFVGCEFQGNNKSGELRKLVQKFNNGLSLTKMFNEDVENKTVSYSGTDININCNNVGYAANSLINLIIEGLIGMGQGTDLSLVGNQINPKMQYLASSNVDSTKMINYARKKAESLCRGKWMHYDERNEVYKELWESDWWELYRQGAEDPEFMKNWQENIYNHIKPEEKSLICFEGDDERPIMALPGITYIIRGKTNIFVPVMKYLGDNYYDIFMLDSEGNLLLDDVNAPFKSIFTKDGFISESEDIGEFQNEVHDALCSEILVNESGEEVLDDNGEPKCIGKYEGENVAVGAFIRGNFIINGHLKHICNDEILKGIGLCENRGEDPEKIKNRYFVYGKFTTKDSFSDLENLFSWRCTNGISSDTDEFYCPQSIRGGWINPYENAFLVVIDQNYDSPLFKS